MTSPIRTVRLPQELLHSITGSLTDAITIYAKKAGVTVSVATGAGPIAVAATGDAVAITGVIVGVSTVTNLQAAIAASAAVDAILGVSGVGATIFGAAYAGLSLTRLFADFSVDVHGIAGRTVAGKYVPLLLNDNGELPVAVTIGDTIVTNPYLPATPGATSTKQQGTLGRLNQDLSYAIAAGKTISFHPLQHGVSVSVVSGGAAAVLATGRAVVFTEKSDDTTTLTAMLALLAASNAAGLVAINLGTAVGADTWNHLLTLADTALWASGTIPAQLMCAVGPDGYNWPVELDASGGVKSSQSSLAAGEDITNDVQKVEHRYSYANGVAEAQVKATGGLLHTFRCNCTTAGTITIYNNTIEGAPAIDAIPMAIGDYFTHVYDVSFATALYVGFDASWAGSWFASYR
jgi:hypothetical protein